jgi:hypothetical protein
MQRWAILLSSLLLAACASAPISGPMESLFHDRLFGAPSERVNADDVFALTPEMKRYAEAEVSGRLHNKGRRQVLIDALYEKGELKLDYDSAITRNAAQAFEARSGNCLSLVIMTAAFAKEVGLPVRFQNVYVDETWGRSGDIYLSVGHVNLTLGTSRMDGGFTRSENDLMTIDFLPASDVRGFHTHVIGEETIIAMYMNNRAVEALARGLFDDAYGWAREAIRQDPRFLSAYNTLGVIYWRHGNASDASEVFAYVLAREPANASLSASTLEGWSRCGTATSRRPRRCSRRKSTARPTTTNSTTGSRWRACVWATSRTPASISPSPWKLASPGAITTSMPQSSTGSRPTTSRGRGSWRAPPGMASRVVTYPGKSEIMLAVESC